MIVTIFKDIKATSTGFFRDVKYIIERIYIGKSKKQIEKIRATDDKTQRNKLKQCLPSICFSGKFNTRCDSGLLQHSGLICLDFDNIPEDKIYKVRKEIESNVYTFICFLSPSATGLKVVVKIPASKETHRSSFRALEREYDYEYFDNKTGNESRPCYESYDPDIYVNYDSLVFKIFDNKDTKINIGTETPLLKLTSENEIINKLLVWFNKNYTVTKGQRNNNLFILASSFNSFGVSKIEAERTLLNYASKDFTEKEIQNLIKSAYSKKNEYKTKFFEDNYRSKKIEQQIRSGKSEKEILLKNDDIDQKDLVNVISDLKENLTITDFWSYNKNGDCKLKPHRYKQFLEQNGFYKFYPKGADNFIFIRIEENKVDNASSDSIKDFVLNYLYEGVFGVGPYDFMAASTKYFKDDFLSLLDTKDVNFKEDTPNKAYLYFNNCALEIGEDYIKQIDYLELDGYVWKKHIIDADYVHTDEKSVFEEFVKNVSGNEHNNLSLQTVIGYLSHSYKNSANNKSIIFNDSTVSETPNGGSGKGLICNAVNKIKRLAFLDGKQFDFNKSFLYQTVTVDTQVLVFDDVKKNFQFENLFSLITEGITIEKKNRDAIKIPVHKSPKIVITTNYTIKALGGSFDRRKFEIELSSHYNEKHTPFDDFGHMLFDDWDVNEYNKFYCFMIKCIQNYLKNGLYTPEYTNLDLRKFINQTSYDFFEWINDEQNIKLNTRIYRAHVYNEFIEEYSDYKKWLSQKKFSSWIDIYAEYKGFEIEKGRDLAGRYTIVKDNNFKILDDETVPF